MNINTFGRSLVYGTSKVVAALFLFVLFCCSPDKKGVQEPERFTKETEKVLHHFSKEGDSLKLLAAHFILENAKYHRHQRTTFIDTLGKHVDFNVYDYESGSEIDGELASLALGNKLRMYKYPVWDVDSLQVGEIIENVELAFKTWKTKPWAKHVSFDQFCEFILPHRAYNEPLEHWRPHLQNDYDWVTDSLQNRSDPIEACKLINTSLASWLKFDWDRGSKELNSQSVSEIIQNKHGKCRDLVAMTTCAMRSQGVPVAIDFVPHWAHRNSGHFWNVVLSKNGELLDFGGAEKNPGEHEAIRPYSKVGKVYRHTYGRQEETLAAQKEVDTLVPELFHKFTMKDVTKSYVSVGNIEITDLTPPPTPKKYVYLCTYNSGTWKPIHWAELDDNKATFTDMDDNNVLYLPAYFHDGAVLPAGAPFLFSKTHEITPFSKTKTYDDLELKFFNKLYDETIGNGTLLAGHFEKETEYTLSYWDGYWRRAGKQIAEGSETLKFLKVPNNALLRIESSALSNDYQRPFIIKDNAQYFW